jgi:hypothetical protein
LFQGVMVHTIEMHEPSEAFAKCLEAAGRHLQSRAQDGLSWLKADLRPPFLEHLSFRLGNQVFFIRIEDVNRRVVGPASHDGLLMIADGWNGHASVMPMKKGFLGWTPQAPGWGLLDARTGKSLDPFKLVTGALIEMTDWELHDFAVQTVRDQLIKEGRGLMSAQGNPGVNPSIWFVGDNGPEWVVVRAVRYPQREAAPPSNWATISESCRPTGKTGHFASVAVANADDSFQDGAPPKPLWRGHGMHVRYAGLEPGPA